MKIYLINMPENLGMTQVLARGEGGVSFDGFCYGPPPTFTAPDLAAAEKVIKDRLGDGHTYISCEHDDPILVEAMRADLSHVEENNARLADEHAAELREIAIRRRLARQQENEDAA